MKKKLVTIIMFLLVVCDVQASSEYSYQGVVKSDGVKTDEVKISDLDVSVYVELKLELLLGEPVRSARGVLAINSDGNSDLLVKYKNQNFMVPRSEVEKISVTSCLVKAGAHSEWFNGDVGVDYDLGALSKVHWGKAEDVKNWTKAQKENACSFNVSGSPAWDRLFCKKGLGYLGTVYLNEADAKECFSLGLQFSSSKSKAVIDFNLNAVKEWCDKQISKNKAEESAKEKEMAAELDDLFSKAGNDSEKLADPFAENSSGSNDIADPFAESEKSETSEQSLEDIFKSIKAELVLNKIDSWLPDHKSYVKVSGRIKNMTALDSRKITVYVNGGVRTISISDDGSFSKELYVNTGDNKLKVEYRNGSNSNFVKECSVWREKFDPQKFKVAKKSIVRGAGRESSSSKKRSSKTKRLSSKEYTTTRYYAIMGQRAFLKDDKPVEKTGKTKTVGTVLSKDSKSSGDWHPHLKEVVTTFTVYYKPKKIKTGLVNLLWTEYAIVKCVFSGKPHEFYSEKAGYFKDKDSLKNYTVEVANRMSRKEGYHTLRPFN